MNLILLIVIVFFMWLGFALYKAYDNIVSELKQMREKCIGKTVEKMDSNIVEKPVEQTLGTIPTSMVDGLKFLLKASL